MTLVFASNNPNKIQEIQQLMPKHITILSLASIGCKEDIPETADTIEDNAILKANYIAEKYGYNCFADDTGLEVETLDGAPGVHSARYAGEHRDTEDNISKLLAALKNKTNRNACFKTVIVLNLNGKQMLFTGVARGKINLERKGNRGFGYDPVFTPEGHDLTFAEISISLKGEISHRGKAVKQLIDFLKN